SCSVGGVRRRFILVCVAIGAISMAGIRVAARSSPWELAWMFNEETVLKVHHWTDRLFSFTTTRSPTFRFESGQFSMLGLPANGGKPLLRAYSIASANYEDHLEFFSIKVPDGPLTSRLQHLREGDKVLISRK